jgi:hypothetical protein
MTLPVEPTGRLAEILAAVEPGAREVLEMHLLGGASADWLAFILTAEDYPISASTIRSYRRAVKFHNAEEVEVQSAGQRQNAREAAEAHSARQWGAWCE